MLIYKFDVFESLKEKYNHAQLTEVLSSSTLQKLKRGEMVSMLNINNICNLLKLQPGTILKYVPDEEE